jgi:ABC-type polysaccharide/polyol phosphate transport system ATPase subunit
LLPSIPVSGALTTPAAQAAASAPATASPAVAVRDVGKTFRLPHQQYSTIKERVLHPFRSRTFDELRAVDDVSFEVAPGEFFGIVGRNGSGKSTLLKCLAGIYEADRGEIHVDGRLSPFIELGVGFNPDLTARDNVVINAIMLGLTRRQARERFDEIIAFAELEEFLDLKLKNYSSGMSVRLAFSTAIQVDADILLVDEVLAVGDAAFQQKCYEQFQRMKDEGRTIVFVTHDMGAVERFCDRAMLIERGRIVSIADPHTIARAYNEINFGRLVHETTEAARSGDQAGAEITAAWFEHDGERVAAIGQGDPVTALFEVRFHRALEDPIFAVAVRNDPGHTVFATSTAWEGQRTGAFAAGEVVTVRVTFDNWLAPSRYKLTPSVARAGGGADALDLREDLAFVVGHGSRVTGGIVDVPHEIEVRRA